MSSTLHVFLLATGLLRRFRPPFYHSLISYTPPSDHGKKHWHSVHLSSTKPLPTACSEIPGQRTEHDSDCQGDRDSPHVTQQRRCLDHPLAGIVVARLAVKELAAQNRSHSRGRQKDDGDGGHDLHKVGVLDQDHGVGGSEQVERQGDGVCHSLV